MMNLKFRLKLKCAKHPRYDPQKQGEGGIKAGCPECQRMLAIAKIAAEMVRLASEANPVKARAASAS